jgi:hypothetical protein
MRFENMKQIAKGINGLMGGALCERALAEIERANGASGTAILNGELSAWCISRTGPERSVSTSFHP